MARVEIVVIPSITVEGDQAAIQFQEVVMPARHKRLTRQRADVKDAIIINGTDMKFARTFPVVQGDAVHIIYKGYRYDMGVI